MKVTITDVDQRYSLVAQSVSNFLVLSLPSGRKVQVSADDDTVAAVLAESQGNPAPPPRERERPAPPRPPPSGVSHTPVEDDEPPRRDRQFESDPSDINPFDLADEYDGEPQETPVQWPERQVEHHVESGMVEWETLPDTQLPPTIKRILRQSKVEPMLSIEALDALKLEITTRLANHPKPGVVNWDEGVRRKVSSVPRRSVQMDEAGNPIPPGGIIEMQPQRDPGEVHDDENDDDRVQQA